jgi:hypothetical protein
MDASIYLDILKKSLSGKMGKQLVEFEFDKAQEGTAIQKALYALNAQELKEEAQVRKFFDEFARATSYLNGYMITLAACVYEVPEKDKNDEAVIGSHTHKFLLFSVNEVTLTDIGLFYNEQTAQMEKKEDADMHVLTKGLDGFMYPIFTDRKSDVSRILYTTRTPKRPNDMFVENVLGCQINMTPDKESESFENMLEAMTGGPDLELRSRLHGSLRDWIADAEKDSETLVLSKSQMKRFLNDAGVAEKDMIRFEPAYDDAVGDNDLTAANILDPEKMVVKSGDVTVTVKGDAFYKVKEKVVDEKRCLVIELDDNDDIYAK